MPTGKLLSCESTIPAEDPAWSKPSSIPGQPNPVPPRNEPLLYIPRHTYNNGDPHTTPVKECSIDGCELGSHLRLASGEVEDLQVAHACAQEIQAAPNKVAFSAGKHLHIRI